MSKTEPTPAAAANRLIDRLLATTLDSVPSASRVCLNGFGEENGLTAVRRHRYNSTSAVPRKTQASKRLDLGQPPTDDEAFLPALHDGYCTLLRASDLPPGPTLDWLQSLGASTALVCPGADLVGDLVGAVFIVWEGDRNPPEGDELLALMALGVRVGGQIAAVLDLCDQASARSPKTSAE